MAPILHILFPTNRLICCPRSFALRRSVLQRDRGPTKNMNMFAVSLVSVTCIGCHFVYEWLLARSNVDCAREEMHLISSDCDPNRWCLLRRRRCCIPPCRYSQVHKIEITFSKHQFPLLCDATTERLPCEKSWPELRAVLHNTWSTARNEILVGTQISRRRAQNVVLLVLLINSRTLTIW